MSSDNQTRVLLQKARIVDVSDSVWCRQGCLRLAKGIGFSEKQAWEICIAVSELVTNVLKHAGKGEMYVWEVQNSDRGIEIVVEDSGPGIQDIESSLLDGFSDGRLRLVDDGIRPGEGLGTGLGAVVRLMDEVRIENRQEGGARVIAKKAIKKPR